MTSAPPSDAWIETMRAHIEKKLEADFSSRPQTELIRAARYAVQGGGHRWRGLMALAAGGIFDPEAAGHVLPLAASLEMMHAASLVLDDLPSMDDAQTRREKACVHLVFPSGVVDMLPAFLVNMAYQVFTATPRVSKDCLIRGLQLLGTMGADLAHGQEQDLALAEGSVDEKVLMECYALKSGSLFAAAIAGGGLVCGAGPADAGQLQEAGIKLGQAYQILDDIADGPSSEGVGEDVRPTLVQVLGAAGARTRARELLSAVDKTLVRFGPSAGPLRELLGQILSATAG